MNPKQDKFCILYASDREFFGNGTQSYIEAYQPKQKGNWYNSARAQASILLTKHNILKRIDELLEIELNNSFVDKRLGFWVTQLAHPSASMEAIREYNKLKKRTEEKLAIKYENFTEDQLINERKGIVEQLVANRQRARKKKTEQ